MIISPGRSQAMLTCSGRSSTMITVLVVTQPRGLVQIAVQP